MSTLPRQSTNLVQPLSKSQWHFFFFSVDTENPIPKFMWNLKGPLIARIVLKKKKKKLEASLPDFKVYYKPAAIKIMWCRHEGRRRPMGQDGASFGINPHVFSQMIFDKCAKFQKQHEIENLNIYHRN